MAITKTTEIGKMEIVTEFKHIQVRTDTVLKEDGVELSRTFHRHVVTPDISSDNLAKEDAQVQGIANAIWTDEIKTAWQTKLDSQG
tara:strand:- start:68 stop:325 length:258 start_codon:yes stop_codon:yes gene_type:complete